MLSLQDPAFVGVATAVSGWDYTSDFSGTDGWSTTASSEVSIDEENETMDFAFTRNGSNQAIGRDFGVISDSAWIFRAYEWNFSDLTGLDSSVETFFGFSSLDQSNSSTASQDSLMNFHRYFNTASKQYGASESDNAALQRGSDELITWSPAEDTNFYLQVRRTTDTTFKTNVFDDSGFTSSVDEESDATIASTVASLRYLKYMNDTRSAQLNSTITGTLSQIKFANGVSEAPS
jgi:hypothetical protein